MDLRDTTARTNSTEDLVFNSLMDMPNSSLSKILFSALYGGKNVSLV